MTEECGDIVSKGGENRCDLAPELEGVGVWIADRNVCVGVGEGRSE